MANQSELYVFMVLHFNAVVGDCYWYQNICLCVANKLKTKAVSDTLFKVILSISSCAFNDESIAEKKKKEFQVYQRSY